MAIPVTCDYCHAQLVTNEQADSYFLSKAQDRFIKLVTGIALIGLGIVALLLSSGTSLGTVLTVGGALFLQTAFVDYFRDSRMETAFRAAHPAR